MIDELRLLAVFAKVVEFGSFRAAATALSISPSVISHHITHLEQRLGVALIYRSTRRLSLTEHGERLFQSATAMVEAAEQGLDAIAGNARLPVGRLNVTAPAVMAQAHLVEDIAEFAKLYPGVELALNFTDVQRDLIREGIDVAIRMSRALEDSSLKATLIGAVPVKLYAAKTYLDGRSRPRKPSDITNWDWLQLSPVNNRARFRGPDNVAASVTFTPRLVTDNAVALYGFARAGLGLAMAPEFLARDDVASGLTAEVLPSWKLEAIKVHAVWPANARRGNLTMRFVEFLTACERKRGRLVGGDRVRPSRPAGLVVGPSVRSVRT